MLKIYCDLCEKECLKEFNSEYELPTETSFILYDFKNTVGILNNISIQYTKSKTHLCQNCAKIIYLFIEGMKKGDNK